MGASHSEGVESTAAIAHHPLHPLSVTLPIGSLVFALVADIVFLATADPFWTHAAFWLLWVGILGGLVAAMLGMTDYLAIKAVRQLRVAHAHAAGNTLAIAVAIANLVVHWTMRAPTLGWIAVALSAVTVGILGVTGFLGGEISYRHRIGQIAPEHGGRIPEPIPTAALTHRRHG